MHNNLHTNYNHSTIQATYISLYASLTRGSIITKRMSTELLINGDRRRNREMCTRRWKTSFWTSGWLFIKWIILQKH